MAISVQNLISEKKTPFVFVLSLLLLFVAFFLFTATNSPIVLSTVDVLKSRDPPPPSPPPPPPTPTLTPTETTTEKATEKEAEAEVFPDPPISIAAKQSPPPPRPPVPTIAVDWKVCDGSAAVDYIPCLDNMKAIKELPSRRHMEHRERHCPSPSPRCLVPLPRGYRVPIPWPKSRDMIWFDNVPHPKLVEYKKQQNWVRQSGEYLVFPGGGTQFKEGVDHYIGFIQKTLPIIEWAKHTRVILDVGCGVASFGGYLLDKDVVTMSLAPKDEHEAQIQFALERGIPAFLSVIGTQRLPFPDNVYDLIHCARCRVHWDADGGKPLLELNRVLRPGGFFIWSATPVYRKNERDKSVWKAMVDLTKSICWKQVAKTFDSSGVGMVIYQKPVSYTCYEKRADKTPPLCDQNIRQKSSWYTPLDDCIAPLPASVISNSWPVPWPVRLNTKPLSLSTEGDAEIIFHEDTKHWSALVQDVYLEGLGINWSSVRNVMDMNAGQGGFAAALVDQPLWVMNVIPVNGPDTLPVIFDRGLIGVYHDWCEAFNTYPRTYDLLHSSFLFKNLTQRASASAVAFGMGLFSGKGNLGPGRHRAFAVTSESRASDIRLRFHDCCRNYKTYRKSQGPAVHKLKEPVLDEITSALTMRYELNFTIQDTSSLWFLCKEEASLLNITDQACALFTPSEVALLEWADDVGLFVLKGYGNALNYQMGVPLLEDILQSMEQAIKAKEEAHPPGSYEKARLQFAHAETLLPFSCLIGLLLEGSEFEEIQKEKPLQLPPKPPQKRNWRGSTVVPFAGNNMLVLHSCPANKYFVQVLHNELPVPLPGCNNSDFCPFEVFKERIVNPHLKHNYNTLCDPRTEGPQTNKLVQMFSWLFPSWSGVTQPDHVEL